MTRTQSQSVAGGEIERIKAHLSAGGRVLIQSYTRPLLLTKRCVDYIRADGDGYRLGWPGRKSEYTFASHVRLIA